MPEHRAQHVANLQADAEEGFPYVFICPERFGRIRVLQKQGNYDSSLEILSDGLRRYPESEQLNKCLEISRVNAAK